MNRVQYRNTPTTPGYYVYVFRIDGVRSYVGKGTKKRLWDHERAALHHKHKTRWQVVLATALRRGQCVTAEVVAEGMSNRGANAHETSLIAQYGRFDLGTGTLMNRTAGGDGLTSEDAVRVFNNPKTKRKLIRARRRTARDPAFRAKLSASQKRSWSDPQMRRHRLAIARGVLARPGVREKQRASLARTNQRPDVRARRSDAARTFQRDPDFKVRFSEAMRRVGARPERKEQMRRHMIERNKDPEYTRRRLEAIKRYWATLKAGSIARS